MDHVELVVLPGAARRGDAGRCAGVLSDVLFVAGCVLASFGAGWCWSLVEWWMRVDIRV